MKVVISSKPKNDRRIFNRENLTLEWETLKNFQNGKSSSVIRWKNIRKAQKDGFKNNNF